MIPPSGQQLELELGDQRAVVVEVGGGLRSYSVDGRDILDGYGQNDMSTSGRGQMLIPWPNRIQDGAYDFDGRRLQLPLTEPEHGNAIHGLVRWAAWDAVEHQPHRVVMQHRLHPQPGYPFSLVLGIEYGLTADGLSVRTTATNVGSTACPYGCGAHPYLTLGTQTIDDVVLHVPAETILLMDERGLPVGSEAVGGTEFDFRIPRRIGSTTLDNAFTGLVRDAQGLAWVELRLGEDAGLSLWVDESYGYLMVFTGDPLPDVNRRSVAIEPMTCPPNAFRTGDGLIRLEPGASQTCSWGINPERIDP